MSESLDSPWYVSRNGQQFGPMSRTQIDEMYALGKIVSDDQLWSADLGDWKRAEDVLGRSQVRPPPPPRGTNRVEAAQTHSPARSPGHSTVTHTIVEGGSFKFGTFVWLILGLIVPLWPITLPICWFLAYRSYKKPSGQIVRVTSS